MKIQGFQNIPSVLQNIRKDVSSAEGASGANPSSSVTLSAFAETLQSLQRSNAQATASRQARVDALTSQEQSGKLVPDLSRIAEKLQELNVIDLEG
jgi:anti-sigma28 factor (negative regulator of flagellin synthesis)